MGTPLSIAVLVKYAPNPQSEPTFGPTAPYSLQREDAALSELDEYAIEAAVQISEELGGPKHGGRVTALTMGPEGAAAAVKKALQMGAQEGVHLCDPALAGSDAPATACALAATLRTLGQVDLVLCGMESTDAETSLVPGLLAAYLRLPLVSLASQLRLEGARVIVERTVSGVNEQLEASLPALVSVTDRANHPRYPTFTSILAARKRPIRTLSLSDIGLSADQVGAAGSSTSVHNIEPLAQRRAGPLITDEGDGGVKLVDFLESRDFFTRPRAEETDE